MAYQGGNPHQDGHDLQQYPGQGSTYHMPPARDYDSDDEQERVPLNSQQPRASPFEGPFDERSGGGGNYPPQGYNVTLSDSYAPEAVTTSREPQYGGQGGQVPPRSDTSSVEAWRQRQAPTGLRRFPTRKIKLTQGQALSIDHPVPSAIQNAIQTKYRQADVEGGSEEFTHMRCSTPIPPPFRYGS